MVVLDSSGVTAWAAKARPILARYKATKRRGRWEPPAVPAVVLAECLTGHPGRDARVNQLLEACEVVEDLPEPLARRAAQLRTKARQGSPVDALVVAYAEEREAKALTGDVKDLRALAQYADGIVVESV